MKVILLRDVKGMGGKGKIVEVSQGYAANFLFPQKMAEPATEQKLASIAEAEAAKQAEKEKLAAQLDQKIDTLRGAKVTVEVRAAPNGGLFKKITEPDIVKVVRAQKSLEIPEEVVMLADPIRSTGEHTVSLKGPHKKAEITVVVTASIA